MAETNPPSPRPRTVISEAAGVTVTGADNRPADALAGALPAWDLLPATQFIRRR